MSAPYFDGPASPVIAVADAAALRAVSSNLFVEGANARIAGTDSLEWDPASVLADDGANVIKPSDIAGPDPGRWIRFAGDLTGPVTSTDNALVRFDGFTGDLLKDSNAILTDAGQLSVPELVTGDLHLQSKERNAHWTFREHSDYIEVINQKSGEQFRLALTPFEEG